MKVLLVDDNKEITDAVSFYLQSTEETKKYQINFNGANYNFKTRKYETRDGRNITYEEASRDKQMCEKCSKTFLTFKMLMFHKNQVHSY